MIHIASHRKKLETLEKEFPGAKIIDVTSHATDEFVKFSPFYPNRLIPVPFSEGVTATCVEGIWQGLKVFEHEGIDRSCFRIADMKNIKRTCRKHGNVLGHQKGVNSKELLNYLDARRLIYLPSYRWVLEHRLSHLVEKLKEFSAMQDIVLLDYETNCDINNTRAPLSHAYLIKLYIEGNYPE